MAEVLLSLGSNLNKEQNITSCIGSLQHAFGEVTCSPVYESESVGFEGSNFYNLVVKIVTALPVLKLSLVLREIENRHGRDRSKPRFSSRTLDIDILTYDSFCGVIGEIELPRAEIVENAFVLRPLADLAPNAIHPLLNQSFLQLWQQSDFSQQKLWQVELDGISSSG